MADLSTRVPDVLLETKHGIGIVGDDQEVFYLGQGELGRFVARLRPPSRLSVGLTIPRSEIFGPVVDDAFFYWAEATASTFVIRRASRAGDGTDAATITETPLQPDDLIAFGGYVWWGAYRARVTGGQPQEVQAFKTGQYAVVGLDANRLYLKQYGANGSSLRLVAMDANATLQILADNLTPYSAPVELHVSGNDVFWSANDYKLYRLSLTGGIPEEVAMDFDPTQAFGVTPSEVLYGFTATGFKSLPR